MFPHSWLCVSPPCWSQVIADLEEEKRRHAEDTAEGDDVTYILEKEKERLQQQVGSNKWGGGPKSKYVSKMCC